MRPATIRFAERCIQQTGVVSLRGQPRKLATKGIRIGIFTTPELKTRAGFEVVLRSERAARKLLQEIRASVSVDRIGPDFLDLDLESDAVAAIVHDCAHRIGIEVLSLSDVEKAVLDIARRIEAAIAAMHGKPVLRTYNQEYKQERLRRQACGEKMPNYQTWITEKVAGTVDIKFVDRILFSKLIPAKSMA